jgi:hypothetical protein
MSEEPTEDLTPNEPDEVFPLPEPIEERDDVESVGNDTIHVGNSEMGDPVEPPTVTDSQGTERSRRESRVMEQQERQAARAAIRRESKPSERAKLS